MMHGIEQHLKAGTPRACPWVSQESNNNNEYDRYKETKRVYAGENFEDIDAYYGIVFFNKEDCERFCEYKNSQNIKD